MENIHYATKVTDWLNDEGADFILYDANAPCIPQARPIEKYWATCKKEYKIKKKSMKNERRNCNNHSVDD